MNFLLKFFPNFIVRVHECECLFNILVTWAFACILSIATGKSKKNAETDYYISLYHTLSLYSSSHTHTKNTHTHMHTHSDTHTHSGTHTHTQTHTHTHTHSDTHIHIHTHTHAHTQSDILYSISPSLPVSLSLFLEFLILIPKMLKNLFRLFPLLIMAKKEIGNTFFESTKKFNSTSIIKEQVKKRILISLIWSRKSDTNIRVNTNKYTNGRKICFFFGYHWLKRRLHTHTHTHTEKEREKNQIEKGSMGVRG